MEVELGVVDFSNGLSGLDFVAFSTYNSTIFPATSLETTVSVVSIVPEAKGASEFSQAHSRSAADNVNITAAIATAP